MYTNDYKDQGGNQRDIFVVFLYYEHVKVVHGLIVVAVKQYSIISIK